MKKILLTILFAAFMLSALSVPSYSQTIGVSVGDWFEYEGTYSHETTDNATQVPGQVAPYAVWEGYEKLRRTVTDVTGTNVTFSDVYTLTNGSTMNQTFVHDITAPAANEYWVIANDVEEGDEIGWADTTWLGAPVTITGTSEWEYETETRDCVSHESQTAAWATVDRAFWWDADTGILVKMWLKATYQTISFTEHVLLLTATSEWDIPEFPTGTAMLLVFVAIAVSIDIYRRKKLKL